MSVNNKQNKVLLIGSGMVTGPYIEYLLKDSRNYITVASNLQNLLDDTLRKFSGRNIFGVILDITKEDKKLYELIKEHDIIASFVPPFLHPIVAKVCLEVGRNMITSSYVSPYMKEIESQVKKKDLVFFNEIGLDPGLDHVICHKVIHEEEQKGNKIVAFESWCGALPSPEVCNNPFRYKFSWSPKGALIAMNNSISQLVNGKEVCLDNMKTLTNTENKQFHPSITLEGYYNRDSFPYKEMYGLHHAHTIIRGTLRYRGSAFAFQLLKNIGFYEQSPINKEHSTLKDVVLSFVKSKSGKAPFQSISSNHQSDYLIPEKLRCSEKQQFYFNLASFALSSLDKNYIDIQGGYKFCFERAVEVFEFLDLFEENNKISDYNSPLDAISTVLESKLKMEEGERDMDFMTNEFTILTKEGELKKRKLDLLVFGNLNNSGYSATALTVGTPAAIVTQLILDGKVSQRGIVTPTCPRIGGIVLSEMSKMGIKITEDYSRVAKF